MGGTHEPSSAGSVSAGQIGASGATAGAVSATGCTAGATSGAGATGVTCCTGAGAGAGATGAGMYCTTGKVVGAGAGVMGAISGAVVGADTSDADTTSAIGPHTLFPIVLQSQHGMSSSHNHCSVVMVCWAGATSTGALHAPNVRASTASSERMKDFNVCSLVVGSSYCTRY